MQPPKITSVRPKEVLNGRRVSKSNGKLYWYGSGGEILAETDGTGATTAEYVFLGGQRIAMRPAGGNPIFYVEDMLGTSRVTTTSAGVVCYDADYYPYGGERSYTNACPQNYKFEGKERDAETGNDDFGARYYSNRFGRWLSADWSAVPYANLLNPQTLNLYSMVGDDPESFADLDGHDLCKSNSDGKQICDANRSHNAKQKDPVKPEENRRAQGLKGAGKVVLGVGLILTVAGGDIPGGAAGALLIASASITGATTTVSGVADVAGAATKTDTKEATEALEATSNLPGLVTAVAFGGNLKAGQTAATLGDAAALGMSPREATRNLATAVDAGKTVFGLGGLLHSAWNGARSGVETGAAAVNNYLLHLENRAFGGQ